MCILHHSKITFYTPVSRHIMKRYRGLESKSFNMYVSRVRWPMSATCIPNLWIDSESSGTILKFWKDSETFRNDSESLDRF